MDVFDPVLGNGCCTPGAKGITWHPIKTATNGQLALGMTRWIIENKAYNADYLGFTNYKGCRRRAVSPPTRARPSSSSTTSPPRTTASS